MSLIKPSVSHRQWAVAPSEIRLDSGVDYRRHAHVNARPVKIIPKVEIEPEIYEAPVLVEKKPRKKKVKIEAAVAVPERSDHLVSEITALVNKLELNPKNIVEALEDISKLSPSSLVSSLLENIKKVYTALPEFIPRNETSVIASEIKQKQHPAWVTLIANNRRTVQDQLRALIHKIAEEHNTAKFKRYAGTANKHLELISSFADHALQFPPDAFNVKQQFTDWMAQAADGLTVAKNSKKKYQNLSQIDSTLKSNIQKQVEEYNKLMPQIGKVSNVVDTTGDVETFYGDIARNLARYDACVPYFLPSENNSAILQYVADPKMFGDQLKNLVNKYVRSRYDKLTPSQRQELPVCAKILHTGSTVHDLTTCMDAIDELGAAKVVLKEKMVEDSKPKKKKKKVSATKPDLDKLQEIEHVPPPFVNPVELQELEEMLDVASPSSPDVELQELEQLLDAASPSSPDVGLQEDELEQLLDAASPSSPDVELPQKEPQKEPQKKLAVPSSAPKPIKQITSAVNVKKAPDKVRDMQQEALEELVKFAQMSKNRNSGIEIIKRNDESLVPRVERFYKAFDELKANPEDDIAHFVANLKMSESDKAVLVKDLERALNRTSPAKKSPVKTPQPSPKKSHVKTPQPSPKKSPVKTPQKTPQKEKQVIPDDFVKFALEPGRPRVPANGMLSIDRYTDLKNVYENGDPKDWSPISMPILLRLRRAYPFIDYYINQFKGDTLSELIELVKLNVKPPNTRAGKGINLQEMSPADQEVLARDLESVLPLYSRTYQPELISISAGRPTLTRHDLILKLMTKLTTKFKTQTEWQPVIAQIQAKPSLVPIKAMYPANMRQNAARDLKLLDDQLRKDPKLIYLSLIDRVGHPDFAQALSATQKRALDHF